MLNQRHAAAQAVANELFPAERGVDDAIIHGSKLAIAVIEGRRATKVPLSTGQEGLDYVVRANVQLCKARRLLAQAHTAFRVTQIEVGLQAMSYGDNQECPPSKGQLQIVPSSASAA